MRAYVVDLAGGTITQTVQIQSAGTLRRLILSFISAAVGKIEVSRSSVSQIGTAQPTKDVLARINCSATAGNVIAELNFSAFTETKFKAFDSIYIHQTGAGNVGSASFEL